MPEYDYQCQKCNKSFSLTLSISEHGSKRVRCPSCNSLRVKQVLSPFFAQTSKKS